MILQKPNIGAMIFEHTGDSKLVELPFGLGEWHLPGPWYIPGTHIDVSPTKHVVFMILAATLVFLTLWYGGRQVARRHREGRAPRGIGAAVEAMVLFVRNDVAVASIGHGGEKFAPYILTLFFFILYCNLLGLLEISGFIALGPKGYLKTIVMIPPGMKGFGAAIMAIIMTPVELIGKIVKPFALTLRLFANMTAGHFVILVLLGLIFVFGTAPAGIRYGVAVGSVGLTLFMMLLELLVAFLQAYIFALLTSVFIGLMRHEH
ncbi:MAG: hypothetical protein AUH41_11400 [Gemmatimonadetes bacterium 13_1_40CM_66_11]|nr:MAG: hypothetical protein AUH41_11400 [Gemmatimonadetes bacterium 13_1_40CM_66_11]